MEFPGIPHLFWWDPGILLLRHEIPKVGRLPKKTHSKSSGCAQGDIKKYGVLSNFNIQFSWFPSSPDSRNWAIAVAVQNSSPVPFASFAPEARLGLRSLAKVPCPSRYVAATTDPWATGKPVACGYQMWRVILYIIHGHYCGKSGKLFQSPADKIGVFWRPNRYLWMKNDEKYEKGSFNDCLYLCMYWGWRETLPIAPFMYIFKSPGQHMHWALAWDALVLATSIFSNAFKALSGHILFFMSSKILLWAFKHSGPLPGSQ